MKFKPTVADYQTLLDRFFPEATQQLGQKATTKTGKLSMLGKGYLLGSNQLEITDGVPELVTRFSGLSRETIDLAAQAVRHSREAALGKNGLKNADHLGRAKEALARFGNHLEVPETAPIEVSLSVDAEEVSVFIEMGIESGLTADQLHILAMDNGVYVDPELYDRVLDERRIIIVPAAPVGITPAKIGEGETQVEFQNRCHDEMMDEEPDYRANNIQMARAGFSWDYSIGTLAHKQPEVTEDQINTWESRFSDDEDDADEETSWDDMSWDTDEEDPED